MLTLKSYRSCATSLTSRSAWQRRESPMPAAIFTPGVVAWCARPRGRAPGSECYHPRGCASAARVCGA